MDQLKITIFQNEHGILNECLEFSSEDGETSDNLKVRMRENSSTLLLCSLWLEAGSRSHTGFINSMTP